MKHTLPKYRFADDASRDAAEFAESIVHTPLNAPALFIVTGPCASGKTRFVREIVAAAFYEEPVSHAFNTCFNTNFRTVEAVLADAVARGYMIFEGGSHARLESETLESFITSRDWRWRKLGKVEMECARNRTAIFVIANQVQTSADLARRAHFIALVPQEAE